MIFFLLSESIFLTSTFPSFLQSLINASNFSAQNLSSFAFFQFLWSWFYQHTKGRSWQHQVQTHATHHLQSDPSWISLQTKRLNSSNHRTWKRRFWKLVCTTRKSYGDGVQLFNSKVIRSRSLRERPAKLPMSIILCTLWGIRRNIVATRRNIVAPDACGCFSIGGQVGLLFGHRSIKLFEAAHPHLFHTKMNVFLISPQTCPISLNTFRWLKSGVQLISKIAN